MAPRTRNPGDGVANAGIPPDRRHLADGTHTHRGRCGRLWDILAQMRGIPRGLLESGERFEQRPSGLVKKLGRHETSLPDKEITTNNQQ